LKLISEFENKLRESRFFDHNAPDKGVVRESDKGTMGGQQFFTFTIRAKLAKPLSPTNPPP